MENPSNAYLMMIEPQTPIEEPVIDKYTGYAALIFDELQARKESRPRYRGVHTCICGNRSDNVSHVFNDMITNSLILHYVKYHRSAVPKEELDKLDRIAKRYKW